jgi:serine/threonine protein phosphatase PrpC
MGGMKDGDATAEAVLVMLCVAFKKRMLGNHEGFTLEQIALECAIHAQLHGLQLYNTLSEPGATVTIAIVDVAGNVGLAWLGDSPVILQTKSGCRLITTPHNVNKDLLYQGKTGTTSGDSLTRFVGEKDYLLPPDSTSLQLQADETLWITTDGVLPLFMNATKEPPSLERFEAFAEEDFSDNATFIQVFAESNEKELLKKEEVTEEQVLSPQSEAPAVESSSHVRKTNEPETTVGGEDSYSSKETSSDSEQESSINQETDAEADWNFADSSPVECPSKRQSRLLYHRLPVAP